MSGDLWYYRLDGRSHGPFNSVQFAKLIRGGTVLPDTEVSFDGQSWQTLNAALADVPADPPTDPPAGSPADPSAEPLDWMNAPTLMPGELKLPPDWKNNPDPPA
jgi:hypothetical protein